MDITPVVLQHPRLDRHREQCLRGDVGRGQERIGRTRLVVITPPAAAVSSISALSCTAKNSAPRSCVRICTRSARDRSPQPILR